MALAPAELYVESDYIESGYVGGIADAEIGISPYIVDDYIELGYFAPGNNPQFTLVCDTDSVTHQGNAVLSSAFGFSTSVGRYRTSDALLEFQADLLAQGDRSRSTTFNATGAFNIGNSSGGGFSNDILPAVTYTGAADLTCASALSCEALNVQFGAAEFTSTVNVAANAIEYRSRFFGSPRPIDFTYYTSSTNSLTYTALPIVNPNGVALFNSFDNYLTSDPVDLPSEFAIQITTFTNASSSYTYPVTVFTYGNPSDPVLKLELLNSSGTIYWRLQAKYSTGSYAYVQPAFPVSSSQALDQGYPYLGAEWKIIRYTSGSQDRLEVKFVKQRGSGGTVTENSSRTTLLTTSLASVTGANRIFRIYRDPNFSGAVDEFSFHDLSGLSTSTEKVAYINNYGLDSGFAYTTFPNDENTLALHDFNNRITDNTAKTFTDSPTLNSSASLSASITGIVNASATLEGFAATLTSAAKIGDFVVSLDSAASVTASGNKVTGFTSDLSSTADLSSAVQRTRSTEADITSNASISGIPVKTVAGAGNLSSSATLTASVTGFTGIIAQLNTNSSIAADATRIKSLASSVSANTTVTVGGDRIRNYESAIAASAGIAITATRIKPLSADLQGFAATVTSAAMTGSFVASLSTTAALSCDATVLGAGSVFAESSATLTIIPTRIQQFGADISASAAVLANPTIAVEASSSLASAIDLTATATKITDIVSNQNTVAGLEVDFDKFRPFGAELASQAEIEIDAVKTAVGVSSMISGSTLVGAVGKIVQSTVDLQAFNSITIRARTIAVEMAVYRVPAETRTHRITTESRNHVVTRENRTYRIQEGA